VVVADGSVLTATDSENADLFWAIRGGGSNFGVCTEFVLKLHPQRRTVFGGMVKFHPQKLDSVSHALEDWHERGQSEKEVIYVVIGRDSANGNVCVVQTVICTPYSQVFEAVFWIGSCI
jgi:FAD/FMN-containing dehydrogenase